MTALDMARDEWPALRWHLSRFADLTSLYGFDTSGVLVVKAVRRRGERWSVWSEGVAWHLQVGLRDGLRRLRRATP